MAGKPIATLGSNHTCPMCNGTVPHVGGPVLQGEANILINGKPAATLGSMCTCVGPPDTIVQGNASVLFNGKPVATIGDMTAHGGVIISGEANIIISSNTPESSQAVMPLDEIPFPEITLKDKVLAGLSGNAKGLKEAEENQQKIKELAKEQEEKEAQEEDKKELPKLQGEILFVHGYLSDPVTNTESHWNAIMDLNPDKPGWYTLRGENTNEYNRTDHDDYYTAKQIKEDNKEKSLSKKIIDELTTSTGQRIKSIFTKPKEKYTGYWDSKSNKKEATKTYAKHFNAEEHVHYVNGSHGLGSSCSHRIDHGIALGYEWAKCNWHIYKKEKIDQKKEEKPNIESHSPHYKPVTVVGHSQGVCMATGVKLGIVRYALEMGWEKVAVNVILLGVHQPKGLFGKRYDKFIKKKVDEYMTNQNAILVGKEENAGKEFLSKLSDLYNPKYLKVYNNRGVFEHLEEITADFGSAFISRAIQFTFSNDRGDLVTIDGDIPKIKSACNPKHDSTLFSAEYFHKKEQIPAYYKTSQNKELVDLNLYGAKSGFIVIPPYHLNRRFDFGNVHEKETLFHDKSTPEEIQFGKEWGDYKKVAITWGIAMNEFRTAKDNYQTHSKHKFDPYIVGDLLIGKYSTTYGNNQKITLYKQLITKYKNKPVDNSISNLFKGNFGDPIKRPKYLDLKLKLTSEDKYSYFLYNLVYVTYQNMLLKYAALQANDLYAHFSPVGLINHKKAITDLPNDELGNTSIIDRIFNAGKNMFYRMVYDDKGGKIENLTEEQKREQEKTYVNNSKTKEKLINTDITDTDYIKNVIQAYVFKKKEFESKLYDESKHKPYKK